MLALLTLRTASAAHAETTPCRQGITRETTERVFALLHRAPAEADCTFDGVQTDRSTLVARWSRAGVPLPPVSVVPRECAPSSAKHSGAFAVEVPREIAESCPSVLALIAALEQQVAEETPAGRLGSEKDPLFRGARALFAGIFVLTLMIVIRGMTRLRPDDAPWIVLGLTTFLCALIMRASLPFSLGNWYSEVMPASGPPPWMRFGPGFFAFQSLLRDAGLWNVHTLQLSQLLLGAAAIPLLMAVLRELRLELAASAAALLLLVLAPFHARLSATTSEHVLASTLCLALLLSWLRAVRTGDALWFVLTVLLYPAVCATRVDMSVQASLVLLWPLLQDRVERASGVPQQTRWWMVAVVAVVALATLLAAYHFIALPSQHPLPDWAWFRFALRYVVPQFWWLSTDEPGWISLSSVVLALIGALAMAVRRPLLFVRVAGTLFIAFVASGRTLMHDELVGTRYFLFTIPIFVIASGYGFGTLVAAAPRRFRPIVAIVGIGGLALWTGLAARAAYAARYTFQDEYTFARAALAQLPAECTVYQERIRADALPGDLDCCLDMPRSPLVLEFPALHFLDLPDNRDAISNDTPCTAYYEGAACAITPGPPDRSGHEFTEQASAYFQPRCAAVHAVGRLGLLAETTTSPRTTRGLFGDDGPRVRLYRWMP